MIMIRIIRSGKLLVGGLGVYTHISNSKNNNNNNHNNHNNNNNNDNNNNNRWTGRNVQL